MTDDVVALARLVLHQRSEPAQRPLAQAVLDLSRENERLEAEIVEQLHGRNCRLPHVADGWVARAEKAEAELSDARMTIATLNVLREKAEAENERLTTIPVGHKGTSASRRTLRRIIARRGRELAELGVAYKQSCARAEQAEAERDRYREQIEWAGRLNDLLADYLPYAERNQLLDRAALTPEEGTDD